MTVRYSNNSEQREAAEGLMAKLRVLSNAECMDLVKDIQKNYRLPYPARTIGEKIAEARQQSGAEKLKGHDIMALERFDPEVRHMIVFDVLSYDSPVGDKGDKMRLFLTDTWKDCCRTSRRDVPCSLDRWKSGAYGTAGDGIHFPSDGKRNTVYEEGISGSA